MCFKKLIPPIIVPLKLPFPEEPADYSKTMENISVGGEVLLWLENYKVPKDNWLYWADEGIIIKLTLEILYPAQTWADAAGKRHLDVRPEWCNPGVIAHEQAHNSYALLHALAKEDWAVAYKAEASTNKLLQLVFKEHSYAGQDDVEAHAEIYRYLGTSVPDSLKQYYPKLF
jgi:hypothetical protein